MSAGPDIAHRHERVSFQQRDGFRNNTTTGNVLTDIVDLCLIVALFVVPFLMGGRLALGQMVLTVLACASAVAWSLYQTLQPESTRVSTRIEFLVLAVVGLVGLQIVELPSSLVATLSPPSAAVLPAWNADPETGLGLGSWQRLSFTPAASQLGLVSFLSYALLFVVTAQRVRRVEDVENLLRKICIVASGMAVFGLLQFATSNGRFYWFYEHPFTSTDDFVKGSFTNRNHFAQFLAVGIGPLIWWVWRLTDSKAEPNQSGFSDRNQGAGRREILIGLVFVGLSIVVFAGFRSLSRGGMIAMVAAEMVALAILLRNNLVSGRLFTGLSVIGLLVVALLAIFGYKALADRLDDWESSGRWLIWEANFAAVSDYPILGTGIGSHREVYPMYLDRPFDEKEFTHAESSYLQVASETGLVGLSLALVAIALFVYWCIRGIRCSQSKRTTVALAAIAGSLAANLVHALFDFIWYVPGCMVVICVLAACACRLYQMSRDNRATTSPGQSLFVKPFSKSACGASFCGLLVLSAWMIQTRIPALLAEPHWHEYLKLTLLEGNQFDPATQEKNGESAESHRLRRKLMALSRAAKADPHDARIQLRMAMGYHSLFHIKQKHGQNPMTLAQIRDAVIASEFESKDALNEWLQRAFPSNHKYLNAALRHTRRALLLCPLQGHGYLYLAELAFLDGGNQHIQEVCLQQALTVRPYEPQVLFVAGRDAWMSGEIEQSVAFWRDAFHRDEVYQQRIIDLVIDSVPASFLVENFQPDFAALQRLKDQFNERKSTRPDDYDVILRSYAQAAIDQSKQLKGKKAIYHCLYARGAYDELHDPESAYKCLQAALKVDPNSYRARYGMAVWLFKQERFSEAAPYLTWCHNRKPRDETLKQMVQIASSERRRNKGGHSPQIAEPTNRTTVRN